MSQSLLVNNILSLTLMFCTITIPTLILILCLIEEANYKSVGSIIISNNFNWPRSVWITLLGVNIIVLILSFLLVITHHFENEFTYSLSAIGLIILTIASITAIFYSTHVIHKVNDYRIVFLSQMQSYDNYNYFVTPEVTKIQDHFKCCGYNGATDYKSYFKPSTCCDDKANKQSATKENNLFTKCLSPPTVTNSTMPPATTSPEESLKYYKEGCSVKLNDIFNKYNGIFLWIGVVGFICMGSCLTALMMSLLFVHTEYEPEPPPQKEDLLDIIVPTFEH